MDSKPLMMGHHSSHFVHSSINSTKTDTEKEDALQGALNCEVSEFAPVSATITDRNMCSTSKNAHHKIAANDDAED